ncbi:MAG: hypothetical protein ACI39H_04820 [Lachnospiraceae bacterium]
MGELKEQIEQRIEELSKTLDFIQREYEQLPEGRLRVCRQRGEKVRYYHNHSDVTSGNAVEQYLSWEKEEQRICQLAQKQYLRTLRPVIEKELHELEHIKKYYTPEKKSKVYEQLTEERKKLVEPVFLSVQEQFERWKKQEYTQSSAYPEKLIFETDRGEMVRSKSELIIANLLFQEKNSLAYRYEEELFLKSSGRIVYPDFSVMSKKNAKVVYWEHVGMLDNIGYSEAFVRKINDYVKEGYKIGEDLILTFETSTIPLDISVVRRLIKERFLE